MELIWGKKLTGTKLLSVLINRQIVLYKVHRYLKTAVLKYNRKLISGSFLIVLILFLVLSFSSFKKNALRISAIHHDQPVKPLDRAIFWIEFVIRHKGAKHLQAAACQLTWYQYHSLDVIAFLIGYTVVFGFIAFKCCSYCFWKCGNILQKSKTE